MTIELKPEEIKHLEENSVRCTHCGHMKAFHNFHCCEFCKIDGCDCDFQYEEPDENLDN